MKIATVHDVFRSSVFGLPDVEESIAPWLHRLFGSPLTRLGHAVHRFSLMENGIPAKLIAAAERGRWNRDSTGWTWLFSNPEALDAVTELLLPLRDVDLVIGFEMTPNMIRALGAMGRRFIEVTQDPMRFCPDLFFRMRTNDPGIAAGLTRWEVGDETVRREADRLRSRIAARHDGPPAVLFVGQVNVDSSLIANGALTRIGPFIGDIEHSLAGRMLLLKAHPMEPKSADLLALYEHFPRARFTADNIYALLASPAIQRVVTISSSVAAEAPMFDKTAQRLITPDLHSLPSGIVSRFHRVDARSTSIAYWADILDAMPSFMFLDEPPPPLRQRFSVNWGYSRDMTVPVSRRIARGETVGFATGSRGSDMCLFGWSDPEPWGVWSDGAEAMLQFDPPEGVEAVEIELSPFVPDQAHPLEMTLCPRAGSPLESASFEFHSGEAVVIEVPVPPGGGTVELLFRFPQRVSPHQLGLGDDQRLLGVGLRRLTTAA